jgi:hypothetical protein
MPSNGDDSYDYEVCFTVSHDTRSDKVTMVRPDTIFHGSKAEDVVFKVKADSEEGAEEKAFGMLTDPAGEYVKKYGPGFEVKMKYVWRIFYL